MLHRVGRRQRQRWRRDREYAQVSTPFGHGVAKRRGSRRRARRRRVLRQRSGSASLNVSSMVRSFVEALVSMTVEACCAPNQVEVESSYLQAFKQGKKAVAAVKCWECGGVGTGILTDVVEIIAFTPDCNERYLTESSRDGTMV